MTKFKMMSVLGAGNFRKFAFGAIAALTLCGTEQAHAQLQTPTFYVNNQTNGAVWITVYDAWNNQDKVSWFCVLPGQVSQTSNVAYNANGPNVYVQAEGKASKTSCADPSDEYVSKNNIVPLNSASHTPIITFFQAQSKISSDWTTQPKVSVQ